MQRPTAERNRRTEQREELPKYKKAGMDRDGSWMRDVKVASLTLASFSFSGLSRGSDLNASLIAPQCYRVVVMVVGVVLPLPLPLCELPHNRVTARRELCSPRSVVRDL